MSFIRRDAVIEDLPRIVEIYNHAVATRESSCDLEPVSVTSRERWFVTHSGSRRPIWVAEDAGAPERGVLGYLGFYHFMNERPGYFIRADLAGKNIRPPVGPTTMTWTRRVAPVHCAAANSVCNPGKPAHDHRITSY